VTSWLREVPVSTVINSPLLTTILNGVANEQSLQSASECLGTLCRETRDVDDNFDNIRILLPHVVGLGPQIQRAIAEENTEAYTALTRLFAEAGCSWVVAIAREPRNFRPLVEIILQCAALDKDRDVIKHTFAFWYDLKQYITLELYMEARLEFVDIFSKLVDIFLKHLEYPQAEDGNELDLFDGDREQEEKFREFRHQMGDTLKDASEVMGTTECLSKVHNAIKHWMDAHGGQATQTSVPNWQALEAPLFAMRALGRMVDKEENVVLPQLMPLMVQIPSHEKLRFAAIMVIGRYTEWTAAHPEFLEPQFTYIVSSFQMDSTEIMRAAAQSIKYICTDCKHLLGDQVVQLQAFYNQILDKLPESSQEEITEGVANVVAVQKLESIHGLLKLYCDPLVERLMAKANSATNEKGKLHLAGKFASLA
jgi:transportin-3